MNTKIKQKIISNYKSLAENPVPELWGKIESSINEIALEKHSKNTKGYRKKKSNPVIAVLIGALLILTAFVAAPTIFYMRGSNIDFVNPSGQAQFFADMELIMQYSSEVGVSLDTDEYGYILTIDSIAFDGTLLYTFYTVKSENKIFNDDENVLHLLNQHYNIFFKTLDSGTAFGLLGDLDGYFVSDYELKGVKRVVVAAEFPDIFDIEVVSLTDNDIKIPLTIEQSKDRINSLTAHLDLTLFLTPRDRNYSTLIYYQPKIEYNIDKISISPFGNILILTYDCSRVDIKSDRTSPAVYYVIVDDKGNYYRTSELGFVSIDSDLLLETCSLEFYGSIPPDAEYLKLIPYNYLGEPTQGFYNPTMINYDDIELLEEQAIIIPLK